MLAQNSNELKRILCTCTKCHKKDAETGVGMVIPKSTRTMHCKKEWDNPPSVLDNTLNFSSSSKLVSSLSSSDVDSSSTLAESKLIEPLSNNIIYYNSKGNNISSLTNIVDSDMENECTSDSNMKDNLASNWISDSNVNYSWTLDEDDWNSDLPIDKLSDSRNISGK